MKVVPFVRREVGSAVSAVAAPGVRPVANLSDLTVSAIRRLRILEEGAIIAGDLDMALSAACCASMIEGQSR